MKLLHVVGARPNFPKLAPVHRAARKAGLCQVVVHTGQHYDDALSDRFFRDPGIAPPDVNLAVGSDTHAVQTARIMERIESVLAEGEPKAEIVFVGNVMIDSRVQMLEPVGYLEMLDLIEDAFAVITDSGGLQEETTALGIPCLTIRPNTERPVTISEGTNRLVPNPADIVDELRRTRRPKVTPRPEGWDGHPGERVVAALMSHS